MSLSRSWFCKSLFVRGARECVEFPTSIILHGPRVLYYNLASIRGQSLIQDSDGPVFQLVYTPLGQYKCIHGNSGMGNVFVYEHKLITMMTKIYDDVSMG